MFLAPQRQNRRSALVRGSFWHPDRAAIISPVYPVAIPALPSAGRREPSRSSCPSQDGEAWPAARMAEGKGQRLDGRASASGHPGEAPLQGSWAPSARATVLEGRAKPHDRQ